MEPLDLSEQSISPKYNDEPCYFMDNDFLLNFIIPSNDYTYIKEEVE